MGLLSRLSRGCKNIHTKNETQIAWSNLHFQLCRHWEPCCAKAAHFSSDVRGAQRSTHTNSPASVVSNEAKSSPRLTIAGHCLLSSNPATRCARGCVHLCLFKEGNPSTQMRRQRVTPLGAPRLVLEVRGASGNNVQLVISKKVHSCCTKRANSDSLPSEQQQSEVAGLAELRPAAGGVDELASDGV